MLLRIDKKLVLFRLIRELTNHVISDIGFFLDNLTRKVHANKYENCEFLSYSQKKFPYLRKVQILLYNAYCNQIFQQSCLTSITQVE